MSERSEPKFEAAPMDGVTRAITAAVTVLVVAIVPIAVAGGGAGAAFLGSVVLGVIVALGAWAFSPAGYAFVGTDLHVHRRIVGPRRFDVSGATAQAVGGEWLPGWLHLRLVGSGGYFGWFGVFWRTDRKRFNAYVTDRGRGVLIERPDEPDLVVSPEDPRGFVAAFQEVGA